MKPFAAIIFASHLLFIAVNGWAREIIDVTGTHVQVVDEPKRVITLIPSLGELTSDILASHLDRIVGVSEHTDYPPALAKKESIGPYFRFNLEKVVTLKPDLVLATEDGNPKDEVLHLRELGIPVVVVSTETFSQVYRSIELVGTALGFAGEGRKEAQLLKTGVERIRARAHRRAKQSVMLQLDDRPLVVVGSAFLSEALQIVGAENIFSDLKIHYPKPSIEEVLRRNPDRIIVVSFGNDKNPFENMALRWSEFKNLKSVSANRVTVLQADALLRPSLRLLEGLSLLEKEIYGRI